MTGCVWLTGAAEEAGIKVGWTITAVDGDTVNGQDAIFAILGQVEGAELTLEKHEAPLPPEAAAAAPAGIPIDDEVSAAFEKYNRNGDGLLDLDELRVLLEDANYKVDDTYVDGLAGMFGTWDSDGSGGIEEGEFRELWGKLGLGGLLASVAAPPPPSHSSPPPPPPEAPAPESGGMSVAVVSNPHPILTILT